MKFILLSSLLYIVIQGAVTAEICEKDFFKTHYKDAKGEIKNVLLIWYPTAAGADSTLRWCSNNTGQPLKRHCDYSRSENATWEHLNPDMFLINCSSIEMQCQEEPFTHYYIRKNHVLESHENMWKKTKINENADPRDPCLLSTGLSVTRRCLYNPASSSAEWEPINKTENDIECVMDIKETIITHNLTSLYQEVKNNISTSETPQAFNGSKVINQMSELLMSKNSVRVPADIEISSKILKLVTETNPKPNLVNDVLNVANIIIGSDPKIVRKSYEMNATRTLLNTLDNFLHGIAEEVVPTSKCDVIENGVVHKAKNLTSVFYINPLCSNISGIAIFKSRHHKYDNYTRNHYRFLYLNQSLNEILNESDLHLATYFPLSLWNKIPSATVLTLVLYKNDLLFASPPNGRRPRKQVLDISLPNYSGNLPEDMPFIFGFHHYSESEENITCGFWDPNTSQWITTGIKTETKNTDNRHLLICHTSHLTHFGALIGKGFSPDLFDITDSVILNVIHEKMLDYISIFGSGLSLFGLICIWLTAICFRSWREKASNKVLLNICLVLTLINFAFLLLNLPEPWNDLINMNNDIHCMLMGIFLHYNVLVLFIWMLIIGIMQYQRYVTVVGYERPSQYILKYGIIAWGLPLIPAISAAYLEPHSYMPSIEDQKSNNTRICYPSGNSLYFGVILPVATIMLANFCIFVYILHSLRQSLNKFKRETKNIKTQVRLTILLFFLLGISWIFGLLSHLDHSPVLSYMFCITSTLQGFVLFIYFIVIDNSTRLTWLTFCCSKDYYTNEQSDAALMHNSAANRKVAKLKSERTQET